MTVNQLSIFLENRAGQLAQMCRTLAANDISIVALSLADTTDFGIVRLIVSDHEKARAVLAAAGHVVKVSPVFAVTVPDCPGGMAEVTAGLAEAGCDIEYSYAFAFERGGKAVLVFRFADAEKAEKVLEAKGFTLVSEKQVESEA